MSAAVRRSIAARLTMALAAIALVVFSVFGAVLNWALERELLRAERLELEGKRDVVQHYIDEVATPSDLADLRHRLDDALLGSGDLRVWIVAADGSVLYGGAKAPATQPAETGRLQIVREDGVVLTGLRYELKPGGALPSAHVLVALDTRGRERLMEIYGRTTVLACALGIATTVVLCVWVTRRGLKPLHRLSEEAASIAPDALSKRLSATHASIELVPLVDSFNRALERVEEAYRQLEGFSIDVAHELRTPLAILINGTEVTLTQSRSVQELEELLTSHLQELRQLASMVNDMLFLAHADRGEVADNLVSSSMRDEAQRVADYLDASLDEGGHALHIEGDGHAAINPSLIRRALVNLLLNATRYTPEGETIVVRLTQMGATARVAVCNPGVPISADVLPHMFDRFSRDDASRAYSAERHGLGLAIVRAVARMHGGDTFAQSSNGTTIIGFTLRVNAELPDRAKPESAPAAESQ